MQAQYFTVDGLTIGFVACTRAEKYILTPAVGPASPGVLRCYEPEKGAGSDPHGAPKLGLFGGVYWGTERARCWKPPRPSWRTCSSRRGRI